MHVPQGAVCANSFWARTEKQLGFGGKKYEEEERGSKQEVVFSVLCFVEDQRTRAKYQT